MAAIDEIEERPPINTLNMWALGLAMTSFLIPVILSIPAIVLGAVNRRRLTGTDRTSVMNRKLAGLAQVSGLFTLALAAVYFTIF